MPRIFDNIEASLLPALEQTLQLRDDDRLCIIHEEEQTQEPQIICSMGLWEANGV